MNNETIKLILAYDLGSDMHEVWRAPRLKEDGTYEPRMKKSKDEEWNKSHGTDDVDIANCSFNELPSNWQYENLEAAKVVINLVYDKVIDGINFSNSSFEEMGEIIHNEWLKRNNWVYDPQYGDPKLAKGYQELSREEQEKDIAQLIPAINKVKNYMNGLINLDELCDKYHINKGQTK